MFAPENCAHVLKCFYVVFFDKKNYIILVPYKYLTGVKNKEKTESIQSRELSMPWQTKKKMEIYLVCRFTKRNIELEIKVFGF